MDRSKFPEDLIKGRIAETVFELMFREATDFDIYPLGYEYTTPILKTYRDHPNAQHKEILGKVLDNFNDAPDFMLAKPDKSELYLVEVKYRHDFNQKEILEIATQIHERWHPVKLFLATSKKFYYDSCQKIINNHGQIGELRVTAEVQQYYHNLLMRFED